jgi:uncharacterized protein YjbJ (UPF0337 family)
LAIAHITRLNKAIEAEGRGLKHLKQENDMDGQMDKLKGRIKQAAGDLTDNKRLKAEGKAQEFRGTIKNQIDEVADKLKKQV